ncbi:CutC-like protein [Saccharicrinis fermentans DSM 9555 = JCM 21142]|uniref:Copper homeostasis protein cutC homolog n=2 Tax=Saccharicrinis fermentans TaxID=982 RepID=W7YAZ9_9BACT|nr:CutC-like protein [Saccharicrinis fermentans DSM 9555 = JCM 21142]
MASLDVFPMIRPRGGNFVYDDIEQEIMLRDIKLAVERGADGIVIGALTVNGAIDYDFCCRLIEAARGLPITFHRAFDQCKQPFVALEILISMGVKRLLTSGQKNKAIDGVDLISMLQKSAANSLQVMPGSGIDENNITKLAQQTGVKAFHASLRDIYKQEPVYTRSEVRFNGSKDLPENQVKTSNIKRIKSIISEIERI